MSLHIAFLLSWVFCLLTSYFASLGTWTEIVDTRSIQRLQTLTWDIGVWPPDSFLTTNTLLLMVDGGPGKSNSEIAKILTGGKWSWVKEEVNAVMVQYTRSVRDINYYNYRNNRIIWLLIGAMIFWKKAEQLRDSYESWKSSLTECKETLVSWT